MEEPVKTKLIEDCFSENQLITRRNLDQSEFIKSMTVKSLRSEMPAGI